MTKSPNRETPISKQGFQPRIDCNTSGETIVHAGDGVTPKTVVETSIKHFLRFTVSD
jgi:hypothetical protein